MATGKPRSAELYGDEWMQFSFKEKKTEGYFQKKERERVNKLSILCFGGDQYIYVLWRKTLNQIS
jgi:hypothetical protein